MKAAKAFTLSFLLFTSLLFSQSNTFKLGFTGAYPNKYNYPVFSTIDWDYYAEFKMNTWQGWWIGDADTGLIFTLADKHIDGYFQPDTLRWAGYGRVQVNEAEETTERFSYNRHRCGSNYKDETQFGYGQWVRYFNKNSLCNEEQAPAGLVLWDVKENGFQSFSGVPNDPIYQVHFPGDGASDPGYLNRYYVKPRMRISTTDAFGTSEDVVKLIVRNYENNIIKEFILTTENFRVGNILTYDGRYLEDYLGIDMSVAGDSLNTGRGPNDPAHLSTCHVDYQIYWYGTVSVYIDYVKVMDEAAEQLLNNQDMRFALSRKIGRLQTHENTYGEVVKGFYMEEIDYSNLACLKMLNDSLPVWSGNDPRYKMIGLINPGSYQAHLHSNWYEPAYREYIDSVKPPVFMTVRYSFTGNVDADHPDWRNILPNNVSYSVPAHYPAQLRSDIDILYGSTGTDYVTPPNYNNYLQNAVTPGTLDHFSGDMATFNTISKQKNINWISVPQVIFWHMKTSDFWMREPLNSELGATIGIALCNGAKGIMPYAYESGYWDGPIPYVMGGNSKMYSDDNNASFNYNVSMGVSELGTGSNWGNDKRTSNFYGENKWQYLVDLYGKMKTWGPILYNSTNTSGFSVSTRGVGDKYISDIISINPHLAGPNNCLNDNGLSQQYADFVECPDERFWELGFFDDIGSAKYFMAVNRRCVPATPNSNPPVLGDDRVLRVKFNITSGPVNWQISEVGGSTRPKVFSRSYQGYVDLGVSSNSGMGWFIPGEAKLFKIEPVLRKGGELVADEVISGESFTCEAPVYNNGFNITIGANTTIHFNDSSKFVMTGGVFTVGDQNTSAPQNITSDAVPGGSWRGHSFTNCEVKIYGATFNGLANDTTYAVNIIDCPVVDIRNCTFNTNSSLKGGVNAICFNNPFIAINNIYIGSNTFNSAGSTIPTVNVSSYAGVTTPLIIENNTFNEGNTAVFLSGVIGGAIKGNTITDNYIGINALTSSIDVVQNTISSTVNGSMGIFAAGGSELKLNSSGAFTLGGLNIISNEGTGTNNINVDGSYFLLEGGENIFNIASDQSSYHLYGYFPMFTAVTTEETNNCFKVDDSPVDPPVNMVTSGYQGTQITFNFNPYLSGCEIPDGGDGLAIDLGDGIYDTIYTGGSGSGGSQSSVASVRRTDKQVYVASIAKTMYDSISVLIRYRNYTQAKTKCLDLINTYPDSIQSIFAVSKLFLATVASDTSYNAANNLKVFYENLILNHPGNTSLVKRANYYILKCKVRIHEYSQALAGFQQIINQSPYSYEGLIARWDYMATSLLIQGQGGGYSSIDNNSDEFEVGQRHAFDYSDIDGNDDDKKPFTKEQRQDIRKSINTAIEISKNDDETKIKKLEEKSELGDVNASKELTQMKSLKQVVKTEKPKSIIEHVRIVSEDIRKVFGTNTSSKGNEPKNIPLVFRISQNYPNPFNPVTKINYDLPKDSKVKIVIYDILGREVKRLVNNELKTAGSYIVDFNASNYASGVYFYRIEAEEPNGIKFVDSKKMVLVK